MLITDLPVDCIYHIIKFLYCDDVAMLSKTCKTMKGIIEDSLAYKHLKAIEYCDMYNKLSMILKQVPLDIEIENTNVINKNTSYVNAESWIYSLKMRSFEGYLYIHTNTNNPFLKKRNISMISFKIQRYKVEDIDIVTSVIHRFVKVNTRIPVTIVLTFERNTNIDINDFDILLGISRNENIECNPMFTQEYFRNARYHWQYNTLILPYTQTIDVFEALQSTNDLCKYLYEEGIEEINNDNFFRNNYHWNPIKINVPELNVSYSIVSYDKNQYIEYEKENRVSKIVFDSIHLHTKTNVMYNMKMILTYFEMFIKRIKTQSYVYINLPYDLYSTLWSYVLEYNEYSLVNVYNSCESLEEYGYFVYRKKVNFQDQV